jgi:Tfp pilus assembly PilM family ATPase
LQFDAQAIVRLRVHYSMRGLEVLAYDRVEGPWNAEGKAFEEALDAFVAEYRLKDDAVYTVLPRYDIATRILTLPTHSPEEAANMVRLSAEEFVPYTIEEMIIDQCILEKLPNGESRVLAALAHRDAVYGHLNLLRKTGLEPDGIFLSTACLALVLQSCASAKALPDVRRLALANLGFSGIEVVVADRGKIQFSRGIATVQNWAAAPAPKKRTEEDPHPTPLPEGEGEREKEAGGEPLDTRFESLGGEDLPPEGEGEREKEAGGEPLDTRFESLGGEDLPPPGSAPLQELAAEIRGSLSAYRRESESGEGVDAVFLCSETVPVDGWCGPLSEETALPCLPADFAKTLIAHGADRLETLPLTLLGAALMAQERSEIRINLLPASVAEGKKLEMVRAAAIRISLVAVGILIALGALYFQSVHQRQRFIDELRNKVAVIEPKARGVASKRQQLQILRQQVARSGSALELLATVCEAAPASKVNLTTFSYRRREGINLWGRAKSVDDVHAFAEKLRRMATGHLSMFAEARSIYEQEGKERDTTVFDYQIAIPFIEEEESSDSGTASRK